MTAAAEVVRYYGPANTVPCPDCSLPADRDFGDHGGQCLDTPHGPRGRDVIRDWAKTHQFLSINDLRTAMQVHGIPESAWGRAFTEACERGWVERVGKIRATGPGRREVWQYRSNVHAAEEAATR